MLVQGESQSFSLRVEAPPHLHHTCRVDADHHTDPPKGGVLLLVVSYVPQWRAPGQKGVHNRRIKFMNAPLKLRGRQLTRVWWSAAAGEQLPAGRRSPVCQSWWLRAEMRGEKIFIRLHLKPNTWKHRVCLYLCFLARFWACWVCWWSPPDVAVPHPHTVAFLPLNTKRENKMLSNKRVISSQVRLEKDLKKNTHPFAWKSLRWPRWRCYTQK